jgi:HSP20 family protein
MGAGITRWEPFGDLRGGLERVFDEIVGGRERNTPAIDVVHDDGNLVIRADVPGLKPEEVNVEVRDDVLTISGEHEETQEEQNERFVRRERRYGAFTRSVPLPAGVDPNKIEARTRDGVLEIKVPLPEGRGGEPVSITPTAG